MTVALLMRALLSGEIGLFATTLSQLLGMPQRRVAGFLSNWRGQGFSAVYAKAGLPGHVLPVFRAALDALALGPDPTGERISHHVTMRVIQACEAMRDAEALDGRFDALAVCGRKRARGCPRLCRRSRVAGRASRVSAVAVENVEVAAARPSRLEFEGANENFVPAVEFEQYLLDAITEGEDVADAA